MQCTRVSHGNSFVLLSVLTFKYPEYLPPPHSHSHSPSSLHFHFHLNFHGSSLSPHIPLLHLQLALCLKEATPPPSPPNAVSIALTIPNNQEIKIKLYLRVSSEPITQSIALAPLSRCFLPIHPLFVAIVHDRHQLIRHTSTPWPHDEDLDVKGQAGHCDQPQ